MKTPSPLLSILKVSIALFLLGLFFSTIVAHGQTQPKKKGTKTVSMSIVTTDDKGNETRKDTTIITELDSLSKEIEATVIMGGDDEDFDFEFFGEGEAAPCMHMKGSHDFNWQSPQGMFPNMITPWGKITKFEIKDKKGGGKRITIETEDFDGFLYMNSWPDGAVPPPPPPPPGAPKKVIIKKEMKDVPERNE